ncbi:chaperone protein dnaJ 20, chloroplastic-like [Corylus avellana]|uniref:chaperone protein dnaJ 20, chloroplastic-like n=1 Tax=Corylus avellana TaxID=13451 RepID=UPI001E1EBA52|nr:chaperone protein dnaJ 20, chloroplastic-like [Corylus avellana]
MDVLLTSRQSFLSIPLSSKRQRQRPPVALVSISCRAAKAGGGENDSTTSFYEVLSLSPNNANMKEIKKAYRSMGLRYHPDVCPSPMKEESTRIFVQLNAAYATLSDPMLRREYDCELGLGNYGKTLKKMDSNDDVWRSRWQDQILELKRRTNCKGGVMGSWGSRIRAQNMRKKE